jgi:hypothetical protein
MRSCKDDWHDAYYAEQDDKNKHYHSEMQDIRNSDMMESCYHQMCDRACAAGMTLEEHATYWMRTLAYYQTQPDE